MNHNWMVFCCVSLYYSCCCFTFHVSKSKERCEKEKEEERKTLNWKRWMNEWMSEWVSEWMKYTFTFNEWLDWKTLHIQMYWCTQSNKLTTHKLWWITFEPVQTIIYSIETFSSWKTPRGKATRRKTHKEPCACHSCSCCCCCCFCRIVMYHCATCRVWRRIYLLCQVKL